MAWNASVPAVAADVSEVLADPAGMSVDTQQGFLAVSVDQDYVHGGADYPVRWRLPASCQGSATDWVAQQARIAPSKDYPITFREGVILKGSELSETP